MASWAEQLGERAVESTIGSGGGTLAGVAGHLYFCGLERQDRDAGDAGVAGLGSFNIAVVLFEHFCSRRHKKVTLKCVLC